MEEQLPLDLTPHDSNIDIPLSVQEEILRRIAKYKNNPELLIDEETFLKLLGAE